MFSIWTTPSLARFIEREYNINNSKSNTQVSDNRLNYHSSLYSANCIRNTVFAMQFALYIKHTLTLTRLHTFYTLSTKILDNTMDRSIHTTIE